MANDSGEVWHYKNYSNGYIIEIVKVGEEQCESWLLLPSENLWNEGLRGFLYIVAMLYMFMGIAIASDIFMCSIEVITSKKRKVVRWDEEKQERIEKELLLWNETVANLTLMALGSSAPEILLAIIETCSSLGKEGAADNALGTFTIIGSAAFNLLVITAVCIISVPSPQVKKIKEFGVFILTAIWSIFAYAWMLVVLEAISPGEIEPWEAWVTLSFFPIMVLTAYCQDNGWWCRRGGAVGSNDNISHSNVRVVTERSHSFMHGMSKELATLEKEKTIRMSRTSLRTIGEKGGPDDLPKNNNVDVEGGMETPTGSQVKLVRAVPAASAPQTFARARFRHAAVRSMLGGRKHHIAKDKAKFSDVVEVMQKKTSINTKDGEGFKFPSDDELLGKFTFASPSYSVLESAGILEIDVLFHRRPPSKAQMKLLNGGAAVQGNGLAPPNEKETSFSQEKDVFTGIVSVEYETREGSGKIDKDFKYTQGTLTFKETEYRKTVTVPIINDNQYEADVDFYVILKNPGGESGLSDPNITRVTIIDDDEPGEFQFEEPHYYGTPGSNTIMMNVVRHKGCDGTVTIEYSTIDGTAKGGEHIGNGVDYIASDGMLDFKHGETTKPIIIEINKDAQGSKNFICTLRNPSLGAKIGAHSAAVANLTADDIAERLAGVLDDDDEDMTYGDQFKAAMVLETERDDDGEEIPLQWQDYLLHFLTFMWKILFAFIPPKQYLGAWPSFVISLLMIGGLTAIVEQLGKLLGCVVGLKPSVAGITIIALGTSLPDTFASRTAALHDEGADAAIGNVTGSNSVNVFLGLGLPWVISAMYHLARDTTYTVSTTDLKESVILFTILGTVCIIIIVLRRKVVGGELGGENKVIKCVSGLFLFGLWIIYIILSSIKAYNPGVLPW